VRYCLPGGYVEQEPALYVPAVSGVVWQPDVYPYAAQLAAQARCSRIIDLGCSTAAKLLALHAQGWEVVGVDLLDSLPDVELPGTSWLAHDLDSRLPLPLSRSQLTGAALVCADVVEHLRHPERLAAALHDALDVAELCVLSTPDRDRVRGLGDLGPPANPCHAREWTADELRCWLASCGLRVESQTWQRGHDAAHELTTTVVVLRR
jgi:SAM-dependent methyltransferase